MRKCKKIVIALMSLYQEAKTKVTVGRRLAKGFPVKAIVYYRSVLS